MADKQKIRIRLKAYDHEIIDQSTKKIVETVVRTNATIRGPVPLPTEKHRYTVIRSPAQGQGLARALRDAHPQAPARHPRARRPRRSTRSSGSTCRPASTSRSRSSRRRARPIQFVLDEPGASARARARLGLGVDVGSAVGGSCHRCAPSMLASCAWRALRPGATRRPPSRRARSRGRLAAVARSGGRGSPVGARGGQGRPAAEGCARTPVRACRSARGRRRCRPAGPTGWRPNGAGVAALGWWCGRCRDALVAAACGSTGWRPRAGPGACSARWASAEGEEEGGEGDAGGRRGRGTGCGSAAFNRRSSSPRRWWVTLSNRWSTISNRWSIISKRWSTRSKRNVMRSSSWRQVVLGGDVGPADGWEHLHQGLRLTAAEHLLGGDEQLVASPFVDGHPSPRWSGDQWRGRSASDATRVDRSGSRVSG